MELNAIKPNGDEINLDTDKFSDSHSAIMEKAEELKTLCREYKVNFALVVEVGFKGQVLSAFTTDGNLERVATFWENFNKSLKYFTDNKVCLGFITENKEIE